MRQRGPRLGPPGTGPNGQHLGYSGPPDRAWGGAYWPAIALPAYQHSRPGGLTRTAQISMGGARPLRSNQKHEILHRDRYAAAKLLV